MITGAEALAAVHAAELAFALYQHVRAEAEKKVEASELSASEKRDLVARVRVAEASVPPWEKYDRPVRIGEDVRQPDEGSGD